MTHILDQFAPNLSAFRPKSTGDLFALRLAQKLNDAAAARHYTELVSEYSEAELLAAWRRTLHSGAPQTLGRRFHVELHHASGNGSSSHQSDLAAIRVERRAIAVAVFSGEQLSYTQVRQLSSAKDKALASAVGFINWIAEEFHLDSATLESISIGNEMQRQVLTRRVIDTLRDQLLPIWEVTKQDLFQAYGHPPLSSRKELRDIVCDIWPILSGSDSKVFIQDAAALGLHVLIERRFPH